MKLWSWQERSFDPTRDRVDLTRSRHFNNKKIQHIQEGYAILRELIGSDQILWCYSSRNGYLLRRKKKTDLVEWELEIAQSDILAFVDEVRWERLIQGTPYYPHDLKLGWDHEAAMAYPQDCAACERFISEKMEAFDSDYDSVDSRCGLVTPKQSRRSIPILEVPIRCESVNMITEVTKVLMEGYPITEQECRSFTLAEWQHSTSVGGRV